MPEGDTLVRIATALAPVLEGQPVLALALPHSPQRVAHLVGRCVKRVEARGKNLLVFFDEGSVLHTHLRMAGEWHLYRTEERWQRAPEQAVVVLEVPGHLAVCFRAPLVRVMRVDELRTDPLFAQLGPDLLGEGFNAAEAVRRLRARGDVALGVAIMDQRAVAGIGNVYKSELLFRARLDPFAQVNAFTDEELLGLFALARELLQESVAPRAGGVRMQRPIAVYGRVGRPCPDCGEAVKVRRQGEEQRSTYHCARCQPRRDAL